MKDTNETAMGLVERLARHLCISNGLPPDARDDGGIFWKRYVGQVRAMLKLMRDHPTGGMSAAVEAMLRERGMYMDCSDLDVWHEMLDEAVYESLSPEEKREGMAQPPSVKP